MKNYILENLFSILFTFMTVTPIICVVSAISSYQRGHWEGVFISTAIALILLILYWTIVVTGKLIAEMEELKTFLETTKKTEFTLQGETKEEILKEIDELVNSKEVPKDIAEKLKAEVIATVKSEKEKETD